MHSVALCRFTIRENGASLAYHGQQNDASDALKSALYDDDDPQKHDDYRCCGILCELALARSKKIYSSCYKHSEQIAIKFLDIVAFCSNRRYRSCDIQTLQSLNAQKLIPICVLQPTPPQCGSMQKKNWSLIAQIRQIREFAPKKKLSCTDRVGRCFFWLTCGSDGNV